MKYLSSRGGQTGLSFQQVLFSGYAPDGGLYFPERVPVLEAEQLQELRGLSYPQLVTRLMRLYICQQEIPNNDLDRIVTEAFKSWTEPEQPIKISRLGVGLNIAELFHGPTLAFKDLALSVVGQLYEYFLAKSKQHMTVLIGTSGDTGSAAISAVRGLSWVDVVVLLPTGRCTTIQELQMTTVLEDNVHCFAVDGSSDDLDIPIKAVFAEPEYVAENNLCSINSINWARILVQIAHYFYCYTQLGGEEGEPLTIIIPTGACGNIASGFVAAAMGLPVRLVAAVTANDIVHRTLSQGDFSLSAAVTQTWATAMDIQVPYNVERLLLVAAGLDTARVAAVMQQFEQGGATVPADLLAAVRAVVVDSVRVGDKEVVESMARCHRENQGYILCPHTAVGVAYQYSQAVAGPSVVLATAAPDKFPEAVAEAGIAMTRKEEIARLFTLQTRSVAMNQGDDWEKMLRDKIAEITMKNKEK